MNQPQSSFPFPFPFALAAVLSVTPLLAQPLLQQRLVKDEYPRTPGATFVAFDANGDGYQDLLAGRNLHFGGSHGELVDVTATHLPRLPPDRDRQVVAADLDLDGDVDLLVLTEMWQTYSITYEVTLLRNNGSGSFTDATAGSGLTGQLRHIAVGDLDGDGDLDLAATAAYVQVPQQLWFNDGSASFHEEGTLRLTLPSPADPAMTTVIDDLDGDGDLDVLFANAQTGTQAYANDGLGYFVTGATIQLPTSPTYAVEHAVDVDDDGDCDLVVAGAPDGLLRNDGNGNFTFDSALPGSGFLFGFVPLPSPLRMRSLDQGDLDGDGDDDLVIGGRLFVNDGAGSFVDETALRLGAGVRGDASQLGDWDHDGDLDLILGNTTPSSSDQSYGGARHVNNGQGYFAAASIARAPTPRADCSSAHVADLDGNGESDVLSGSLVLMQRGGVLYDESAASDPMNDRRFWTDSVVGDFDGDGDIDVAGCGPGWQPALQLNDGDGVFASAPILGVSHSLVRVESADLDGDGDLDLVFAGGNNYSGGSIALYLNDGGATFTDATAGNLPTNPANGRDVALGDVDGDGDIDLVIARDGANVLYRNDGSANFVDASLASMPLAAVSSHCLELGDLDGDGDLDLLIGNDGPDRLLWNDGAGNFVAATANHLPVSPDRTHDLALGDVDGDGDLDAMLSMRNGPTGQLAWRNDGTGHFVNATSQLLAATPNPTTTMALADLDQDGDADLVRIEAPYFPPGSTCGPQCPPMIWRSTVLTNMTVQLQAPTIPRLGRDFPIRVFARNHTATDLALVGISAAAAHVPTTIGGVLGIDLSQLLYLRGAPLRGTTGEGVVSVAVPNVAGLAGVEFYTQAIVIGGASARYLTNRTLERIWR